MSGTLETKWGVRDIQQAIVTYTKNTESIPNVAFGFFHGMECDLVQVSGSGYLHEFEIKRAWSDFMADFKKRHFHDDIRIMRLTFVLPESFAGERLKKFCAENYKSFKREFDFLFYTEGKYGCSMAEARHTLIDNYRTAYLPEERFRTKTYISEEMLKEIRNDVDAKYRRKLFIEELSNLYRLGVIRLWHRPEPKDEGKARPEPEQEGANAGARRDALSEILDWADGAVRHDIGVTTPDLEEIAKIAKNAIAAPARTCDMFKDVTQAEMLHAAFIKHCNECDCPMGCIHRRDAKAGDLLDTRVDSVMKCFARFVLSKATDGEEEK